MCLLHTESERAHLFALLQSLSESALCALIERMSRPQLETLQREFGFAGCNCRVEILPCRRCSEPCECRPVKPCKHVLDRGGWVLPFAAYTVLLRRLSPGDHKELLPPDEPFIGLDPTAKVGTLQQRKRDLRALHRPDDWSPESVDDVGRIVSRKDHGSGRGRLVIGEAFADGCQEEDDDESGEDELQADRYARRLTSLANAAEKRCRA